MPRKIVAIITGLLCLSATSARAQFYLAGSEPGSQRWSTISTEDYRFVYPKGCDSLARVYALEWERYKLQVGASIGRDPNCAYRALMPVILHPYLGYSNGSVVWTPRRMEMYTGPDMSSPEPMMWQTMLSIHEQRHVSQMQFAAQKPFRWLRPLFGELPVGPIVSLFVDNAYLEGDAVATETALTSSGRGRTADFLEYMRASFEEGEMRDYARWRYGSQRYYTPDYYKIGYLVAGGMRAMYNCPDFSQKYFDNRLFRRTVYRETGLTADEAISHILEYQARVWEEDTRSRGPFQISERFTAADDYYTSYGSLTAHEDKLYALRGGIAENAALYEIDREGEAKRLCYISASSTLRADPSDGRIYWTEIDYDPRWEMKSSAAIRYFDGRRTRTLLTGGRYYNPCPKDGKIAVCENPATGESLIKIISAEDASTLESCLLPSGIQALECVWVGEELYFSAQTPDGQGIFRLADMSPALEPTPVKINHLFEHEGRLHFTSDRTGVNELYRLCGSAVQQLTNLHQGGNNFVFLRHYLYYTALRSDARMVYRTPISALPIRDVDFGERASYPFADLLSAQEQALGVSHPDSIGMTAPRRYSKALHALNVHSWLPGIYADIDAVRSMSFEDLYLPLSPGATVMFQNELGTLYGNAGVFVFPNMGAQLDLTYRGLYPVLNTKLALTSYGLVGRAQAYVPLNFSSGAWNRGVIPLVGYNIHPLDGNYFKAGVRAYAMLPTPASCYYPRWGLGAEAGIYKNAPYLLSYGYLPGIAATHGFGWSANYIGAERGVSAKLNYAMPILSVDWTIPAGAGYVRNFELVPQYSYVHLEPVGEEIMNIHKVGAAFDVVLGNFFFIRYDIRLGLRCNYVFGGPSDGKCETNIIFDIAL